MRYSKPMVMFIKKTIKRMSRLKQNFCVCFFNNFMLSLVRFKIGLAILTRLNNPTRTRYEISGFGSTLNGFGSQTGLPVYLGLTGRVAGHPRVTRQTRLTSPLFFSFFLFLFWVKKKKKKGEWPNEKLSNWGE
jgi:hypothetical protein